MCVQLSSKTVKGQRHLLTTRKRDYKKTKDLQCLKTHALASTTLTCSPSVSGHFTHCWVSLCTSCHQFNCCRCNHLLIREFLVEIHTAKKGLMRCCLYTSRRLQWTVSCKRSICNKTENNKNKFVKIVRLRFYPKTEHNSFPLSYRLARILIFDFL